MMSEKMQGENNPWYGKHPSEETRQKMRDSRPDVSSENNPMYGKTHSEEARKKMGENRVGKYKGEKNVWYGKNSHKRYEIK